MSMTDPRYRWMADFAEHEHWAGLVGFEDDLAIYDDGLNDAYVRMDVDTKVALYGFVCDLLEEASPSDDDELERYIAERGKRSPGLVTLVDKAKGAIS